jgi:peroxiredoxin
MRFFLPLLLIACLFGAVAPVAASNPKPALNSPAPSLELKDFLTGQEVSLSSQVAQQPVVLLFLTSWSKNGQAALEELSQLRRQKKGSFALVAVFYDKKSGELKDFLSGQKIDFPVLLDRKLSSVSRWQVLILPTIYCLDKGGMIRNIFVDYDSNVKKAVSDWLGS